MKGNSDTLALIASHLVEVIKPLETASADPERFKALIYRLGWNTNNIPSSYTELAKQIVETLKLIKNISDDFDSTELIELLKNVKNTIDAIQNISEAPTDVDSVLFLADFGKNLFELLLIDYLAHHTPAVYNFLQIFNIIETVPFPKTSQQHAFIRTRIKWETIPTIIKDPLSLPKIVYGWGTPALKDDLIINHLAELLYAIGFPITLNFDSQELRKNYNNQVEDDFEKHILKIPFYSIEIGGQPMEASIVIFGIPGNEVDLPGIIIQPQIPSEFPINFHLAPDINLRITAGTNFSDLFGIVIRPDNLTVKYPFSSTAAFPSVGIGIGFDFTPDNPKIIFGKMNSTRFQYKDFTLDFGVNYKDGELEALFRTNLTKMGLIIDVSDSDSFIGKLLGQGELSIEADLAIEWSSKKGIYFSGGGGFEISCHPHLQLGPISLEDLLIRLFVPIGTGSKIQFDAGLGVKGELGPLSLVVEDIGTSLQLTFGVGNLGPVDLNCSFKPPNGVGLSINAGAVIGGGYLFFDFEKEEYAGVLELTIAGFISAKAIGLITTKMPDGSKGFSMLIIITAEFIPPFQLGYGFTLVAVGGLLGLNRTMLLDPLRNAVRTGAVNSIMFPQNVIANAPRIISDLKAIFPPYEGKFLVGPMGKLGWGTPTLITLSLGLIIEIPGNIAILGNLKVALPEEHIPLIQIQVLFVGTIDFDKQMLTFDASLYESFILFMTLEGDMSVRLKWGDHPDFIFTVGGFHPSYTPPPLALPTLRRLAINILDTSIAKIRVECYQAVTSNTVQFGSKAELSLDLCVCSIDGYIGFDALFQFSPFHFIIDVSASFKLSALGLDVMSVRVHMSLEGPTPWRAKGTGSVSFFFFDISADFDITWGESKNTSLPDIAVLQKLVDEFNKKEQWSTMLSTDKNLLVSLRKFKESEESLLILHPAGSLVVQQKLLPLLVNITKVGNQKTSDIKQASISHATSGGAELVIGEVDEDFARGQYQDLSDADKLSKPSFEKMPGGVKISMGDGNVKNGKMVRKNIEYEVTIVDKEPARRKLNQQLSGAMFDHLLKGNSVSKSMLSKNYTGRLQPFTEKITMAEEGYTVAYQDSNKAINAGATFSSEMMAQTYMEEQTRRDPSLRNTIHIISSYEIQEL